MRLRTLVVALGLCALPFLRADAQHVYGPLNNCSGTVGGTAAAVVFTPSAAGGPTAPTDYLQIQNNSPASQVLWINILPSGVATTAPPSFQLVGTASLTLFSPTTPVPNAVSIISSAAGGAYSCAYR